MCPVSGLELENLPQWEDIQLTDSYSVSFIRLGERYFISVPSGSSEGDGMARFLKKRKEFLIEIGLYDKQHIELKDYSALKGKVSKNNRMIFTQHLLEEHERGCLLGLFGYNGPPFIRWSFELGKRLYRRDFPLKLCRDYEQAVRLALSLYSRPGDGLMENGERNGDEDIEKLFYYISSMSWDLETRDIPDLQIDNKSPYKKIYDAIALVKSDFNQIIEKQRETEKAIERKVQEQTILLREERAKLETSLDLLSHDTKNHFISLKYDSGQIEDGKLKQSIGESITEIEELIVEATGIMSSKKRIISIVELMENIRVTSKRVPLTNHDRIKVEYKSPEFLFVHTTALFKNAVSNLIENALKYTGAGNPVKVYVEKDGDVKIHIIDYGSGIPDDEKEKIFEKFYRRDMSAEIEGSGRGLWITNNIIRQEGGKLTISDNPEGGAVFTISLPPYRVGDFDEMIRELSNWFEIPLDSVRGRSESYRTLYQLQGRDDIDHMDSAVFTTLLTEIRKERKEEKQAHIAKKLEHLKNRNPDGKSIIIADDSLYVQYYLARYFSELGLNVIDYVDNGESAIISYRKRRPDYISLDNNMNVKTGPEAAAEIYGIDGDCRIIFITALGDSSVFRDGLKKTLPGRDYRIMTKPVYKKDVEQILENF